MTVDQELPPILLEMLEVLEARYRTAGDDESKQAIPIGELPQDLQNPDVLGGCERRGLAYGVEWLATKSGSQEITTSRGPHGDPIIVIGSRPGWYPSRNPTHVKITPAGLAALSENRLTTARQSRGLEWYTMQVFGQQAACPKVDEKENREAVRTLAARLRKAARQLGLATPGADDFRIGQAVIDWLVTDKGLSAKEAAELPVEDALVLLAGHTDQGGGGQNKAEGDGDSPLDALEDPVRVVWVADQVGRKAGRRDKLADKFRRRGYTVVLAGRRLYCERADAIRMFPRYKRRLQESVDAEE